MGLIIAGEGVVFYTTHIFCPLSNPNYCLFSDSLLAANLLFAITTISSPVFKDSLIS